MSINKVWGHIHYLSSKLLLPHKAELSSYSRDHLTHEAENIYHLALGRKSARPCDR